MAAACLPRKTKHGPLTHIEAIADKVRLCYGEPEEASDAEATDVACVDVDVTGGSVTPAPRWTIVTPAAPSVPVSADGSRTFAFTSDGGTVYGDTFDPKTHKRLFRVKLSRPGAAAGSFTNAKNAWTAEYVGGGLVVTEKLCCDPESATLLLDAERGTTKRLHGFGGAHGAIDDATLFAIDKKKLVFVDASSQRVVAGPFTAPGATFPDPELVNANAVLVGSGLLLAHANPPGYLTIDVAAKKASAPVALPLCP